MADATTVTAPATTTTSTPTADVKVTAPVTQTTTTSETVKAVVDPKAETKKVETAPAAKVERINLADEPPKVEDKKVDVDPSAEPVYTLKLPDGSLLSKESVDEVTAFAKANKIAPEVAQKLLERDHARQANFIASHKPGGAEWTKKADQFSSEALADAEIGGSPEKLKASAELGRRVLEKFFPKEVKQFLIESGLGSNKEVIRGFYRMGKAMKDDSIIIGGAQAPPSGPKSLEDMYK